MSERDFERAFFVLSACIAWALGWGLFMGGRSLLAGFSVEMLRREWPFFVLLVPFALLLAVFESWLVATVVREAPRIWRERRMK